MSREKLFSITKKDFDIQTFRCGGHGGQAVNKLETGVRIRHRASGVTVQSCEHAEQLANKREAFRRLANDPKLKAWIRMEAARLGGQEPVEVVVDRLMSAENLRFEVKDEKKRWIECPEPMKTYP